MKSPRLLWQSTANPVVPFDGVPFLICGRKVLECQYGPKRDARRRKPDDKGCEDYSKVVLLTGRGVVLINDLINFDQIKRCTAF